LKLYGIAVFKKGLTNIYKDKFAKGYDCILIFLSNSPPHMDAADPSRPKRDIPP